MNGAAGRGVSAVLSPGAGRNLDGFQFSETIAPAAATRARMTDDTSRR
jgi:hypothetical protein